AQGLAPRPQRQDRGSEAEEESAARAAASRPGTEADRRDDVLALREIGVRGVRPHGRAHRTERAADQGLSRDRRGVPGRSARQGLQAAREERWYDERGHAAARTQAEDGHAPRRPARAEQAARRRWNARKCRERRGSARRDRGRGVAGGEESALTVTVPRRFRFAPILTATVLTVLLLYGFGKTAGI